MAIRGGFVVVEGCDKTLRKGAIQWRALQEQIYTNE